MGKKRKFKETETYKHTADASDEDIARFQQRFWERSTAKAPAPAAAAASGALAVDPATAPDRDKVAIANLRKTHSAWDRAKRKYTALISKSNQHENTKGCKVETDLGNTVTHGTQLDARMLTYETKFLEGKSFEDKDIADISTVVNQLVDIVKCNNKRSAAMKPWFKLDERARPPL